MAIDSHPNDGGRSRLAVWMLMGAFLVWLPTLWPVAALCLFVIELPPFWRVILRRGDPRRLAWFLVLWVCTAGAWQAHDRVREKGWRGAVISVPDADVVTITEWARSHTNKDAVFLVNPGAGRWNSFPGLSERSILSSWEQGAAINWNPEFVIEWDRRMRLLGLDVRKGRQLPHRILKDAYAALTDVDVDRMRSQFGIQYWIVPEYQPSVYEEVYRSGRSKVLDLASEIPIL